MKSKFGSKRETEWNLSNLLFKSPVRGSQSPDLYVKTGPEPLSERTKRKETAKVLFDFMFHTEHII